jgi:hypothetical protein
MMTGNDITPIDSIQIAFVACAVTMGAIINANIFGNMAIIIQALNRRLQTFQEQIDIANTAMKNMKLPREL